MLITVMSSDVIKELASQLFDLCDLVNSLAQGCPKAVDEFQMAHGLSIKIQVHLKKFEFREKVFFFFLLISKSETVIYSRFITCKVKHFKSFLF